MSEQASPVGATLTRHAAPADETDLAKYLTRANKERIAELPETLAYIEPISNDELPRRTQSYWLLAFQALSAVVGGRRRRVPLASPYSGTAGE